MITEQTPSAEEDHDVVDSPGKCYEMDLELKLGSQITIPKAKNKLSLSSVNETFYLQYTETE